MRLFVTLFVLLSLLFSMAEGFRIDERTDPLTNEMVRTAILRNRRAVLGGRTVIRIDCTRGQTRDAGLPFRFVIRRNGDAFRFVQSVTLRVDSNPAEVFESFVPDNHPDAPTYLLSRGAQGMVLSDFDAFALGSIDFTQIVALFSAEYDETIAMERIIQQMYTGDKLYVRVINGSGKVHNTNYKLAGSVPFILETLCLTTTTATGG